MVFHGASAAAVATAYYRYVDRSELFEKSMKGLSDTLAALKRLISGGIEDRLRPVFDNSQSVTSMILDPGAKQFQESYVSPVGSEEFRNALFAFVQADASTLCDYRRLADLRDKWLFWSRVQSWTCFVALVVECVTLASLFVFAKVASVSVEFTYGLATLAPISILFTCFTAASARMLVLHDRFVTLRKRYASP